MQAAFWVGTKVRLEYSSYLSFYRGYLKDRYYELERQDDYISFSASLYVIAK